VSLSTEKPGSLQRGVNSAVSQVGIENMKSPQNLRKDLDALLVHAMFVYDCQIVGSYVEKIVA